MTPSGPKYCVQCSWDEVPHLSPEARKELWASIPPHQQAARSKGIPELGSGAVYPVPEDDIKTPYFEIPPTWRRVYGLDVGWNYTAAVWAAIDDDNKKVYLYRAYKRGQAEPATHTAAIQAAGEWVPGVCDPAANQANQKDGTKLIQLYRECGLNLQFADNSVESGLYTVWNLLATGRLKVFATLAEWFAEYSNYHRDKRGDVVKSNDHLMDATRYLIMSGRPKAIRPPAEPTKELPTELEYVTLQSSETAWLS